MMVYMSMCCIARESDASLERRARVLIYRLSLGELVDPPAWDPVVGVMFTLANAPRPHGNALGALPEVL